MANVTTPGIQFDGLDARLNGDLIVGENITAKSSTYLLVLTNKLRYRGRCTPALQVGGVSSFPAVFVAQKIDGTLLGSLQSIASCYRNGRAGISSAYTTNTDIALWMVQKVEGVAC